MHPLDKLLILHAQETVDPSHAGSERNILIRQLERETLNMGTCRQEYHGVQCERPVGHDGNCAAVIIF